jgi:hypothetical protein
VVVPVLMQPEQAGDITSVHCPAAVRLWKQREKIMSITGSPGHTCLRTPSCVSCNILINYNGNNNFSLYKTGRGHLNQVIEVHITSNGIDSCNVYPDSSMPFPLKMLNLNKTMRKLSKPKMRDMLENIWPTFFTNVKIIKGGEKDWGTGAKETKKASIHVQHIIIT